MKKRVYFLGNALEKTDRKAIEVIQILKKKLRYVNFVHFDPTEETEIENGAVLLDTVRGIKKVTMWENLDEFETSPRNSVHDFDLKLYLGLLLKLGKIKSFKLIGIPEGCRPEKAAREAEKILENF